MISTLGPREYSQMPGVVVLHLDRQWRIRSINARGLSLLGYTTTEQLAGKSLREIIPAEEQEEWQTWIQKELLPTQARFSLHPRDGKPVLLIWHIETLGDEHHPSSLITLVGMSANAIQQSYEAEKMFRTVASDHPGSILIVDRDFNIVYANPVVARTTGYEEKELLGQPLGLIYARAEKNVTYRQIMEEANQRKTWRGEIVFRKKNGEECKEIKKVTAVRDAVGKIQYYYSIGEDLTLREHYQQQLGQLLMYDQLTGLLNRSGFVRGVNGALQSKANKGREIAVLHVDFDHFENVNAIAGDAGSEHVIVKTAARIREIAGPGDLLARVASNEFLLLVDRKGAEAESIDIAQRILASLREPYAFAGKRIELTASIGIASHSGAGKTAQPVVANAISASKRAKSEGGNDWRQYEKAMAAAEEWRRDLQEALERKEMVVYYQPQVSLFSGAITGLEALLRWRHPKFGEVLPENFISIAEESNVIINIGEWVLNESCRQMREWMDAGLPPIKIAINLTARHFRKENLPACISKTIEKWRIESRFIEIEITESAMMHDIDAVMRNIEQLKKLGVRISLDDFGTGYSSMTHLSRFPIDVVKIDQSFVQDITSNSVNAAIAHAAIAMSHKLGKLVLAEGVETAEQMQYLRRSECDEMQGFYFSRPLPADEITHMLQQDTRMNVAEEISKDAEQTILIVDDEVSILNSLKRILRREGYNILTAKNVEEGFSLLAKNQVKVIISDQQMPDMSGTEFLAQVKSLYPETVRMVLSAYSEIATVTDAINKGSAYRFLTKPWNDEQIKEEIRGALRHWRELHNRDRNL